MRLARRILLAAGATLALLVVITALLALFVDADRFRPQLERLVADASGGELRLHEPLKIGFFPRLALRVGAGEFVLPGPVAGSAAGDAQPFARWRSIRIDARLRPLMRGRLEIGRVLIDGFALALHRDATGGNWEKLRVSIPGAGTPRFEFTSLGGLELQDGSLYYMDARDGRGIRLDHWRFELAAWHPGEPFGFVTSTDLALLPGGARARLDIEARAQVSGPVRELQIRRLHAVIGDASLQGSASLTMPAVPIPEALAATHGQGALTLDSPSLRRLLAAAGIEAPATRDARAVGPLAARGSWQLAGAVLVVEPLRLKLDDTSLEGRLQASLAEPHGVEFELHGDSIDLTRYLEPEDAQGKPLVLDAEVLQALPVHGELRLERAQLAQLRMKGVRVALELEDGRLRTRRP